MRQNRWLAAGLVGASLLAAALAPMAAQGPAASAPATGPSTRPADVPTTTQPGDGPTEAVYRAALRWFDSSDSRVDKLIPAAEAVAERLIDGGGLFAAGNAGFCDELENRAGGFPFLQVWPGENIGEKDVLLIGEYRPNDSVTRRAKMPSIASANTRLTKGTVVHFASHEWPQFGRAIPEIRRDWGDRLFMIDTGAPAGASWSDISLGQMSTTALVWAFHAEVIAAATRKGKTLTTYASDWEPNGHAWDASVKDLRVHDKYSVPPIPAGKLGKEYLRICRGQVADFLKARQAEQVRLAGKRMAEAMKKGGVVWAVADGHIHPRGSLVPLEFTRMVNWGRSYEWGSMAGRVANGDVLLYMAYLGYPKGTIDAATRRGAQAVVVSVAPGPTNDSVVSILSCWKAYDTVIELKNYPIRCVPSSGTVQTPQWYSLLAETAEAMKAKP